MNIDVGPGGYSLVASHYSFNPADAATYYFGAFPAATPGITAAVARCYIPTAGTITRISVYALVGDILGSAQNSTLNFRLNNTTNTQITATMTYDALTENVLTTGLSIAVAQGDYFEIQWVTPTWTTNPTVIYQQVVVWIGVP